MSTQTLATAIVNAFSRVPQTPSDAAAIRTAMGNAIAQAIDAHVQEQIGLRLAQITTAILIPCPTPAGPVPTPPIPGTGFPRFARVIP